MIEPSMFFLFTMPFVPDLPFSFPFYPIVGEKIKASKPDAIHIATEGPLGLASSLYLNQHQLKYTTSYHTCLPEYIDLRFSIPQPITYSLLRSFHNKGERTMVPTSSIKNILDSKGFKSTIVLPSGIDLDVFNSSPHTTPPKTLPIKTTGPIFLYVGRIAVEKNINAFLDLDLPGVKWVVGDGPALKSLREQYQSSNIT